jgi:DNA-binding SARP family transcriptional activator
MALLSLSLLGSFQAWTANGEQQTFRTLKERALLAYLAIEHGRSHRREDLAELLWPDRSEGVARNNLRQAMYGLRQVVGEAEFDNIFLVTSKDVRFNLSEKVWLDVAAYEIHLKAVKAHLHQQTGPCAYCLQHMRDAVEIYRDSFLWDVYFDKNAAYQDWLISRRENYFQLQLQALRSLVEMYESMEEYSQAAIYALRLVAMDDLNESLYRQVMILLARLGQHTAAMEQYELCRQKRKAGLGVDLEQETIALAEHIRQGRFDPTLLPVDSLVHNLPVHLTPFIGREMELAKMTQIIENLNCRLLSVVGPGGVGKTRLAVQAAMLQLRSFNDGVYFVALDAVKSTGHLAEVISRTIGLSPAGDQDLTNTLIDFLRLRRVLLVLDNFEHLLEGRDLLLEILQAAPFTKILVTSRERLHLQAEFLLELSGLPFPHEELVVVDGDNGQVLLNMRQYPAIELLLERSSRVYSEIEVPGLTPGKKWQTRKMCALQ